MGMDGKWTVSPLFCIFHWDDNKKMDIIYMQHEYSEGPENYLSPSFSLTFLPVLLLPIKQINI